jgi:hypothetical protein
MLLQFIHHFYTPLEPAGRIMVWRLRPFVPPSVVRQWV